MKILFQGDSITDAGRIRDNDQYRGSGYATLVSAQLGFDFPGKYEFLNRGISGNRVVDLLARMKADIINLQPDVVSILIGVNDVWHEIAKQNGVDAVLYKKLYSTLIEEIKKAIPSVRIMIIEPFVLKGTATLEQWNTFDSEVKLRALAAKQVAERYGLDFVRLQDKFDAATELAPEDYWFIDGIHPTAMGHELIAHEWIHTFMESR